MKAPRRFDVIKYSPSVAQGMKLIHMQTYFQKKKLCWTYLFYSGSVTASFRRLVADFSVLRPDFNPVQVRVEFVVVTVAPRQELVRVLLFCPVCIIPQALHGILIVCHQCYIVSITDSVVICHICILSGPFMHSLTLEAKCSV